MKNSKLGILFDLDDTLIDTNQVFLDAFSAAKKAIIKNTKVDTSKLDEYLEELNITIYNQAKVSPEKWFPFTKIVSKDFELSESVKKQILSIFLKIYETIPEFKPGAIELLETCKRKGAILGMVTHADKDWTNLKVDRLGIRKYFSHIEIVDAKRFKSSSDWLSALAKVGVKKDNCYIIGDNVKGDIIAGYEVGFRNLIWLDKDDGWKVYRSGDLPSVTIKVTSLFDIKEYLLKNL